MTLRTFTAIWMPAVLAATAAIAAPLHFIDPACMAKQIKACNVADPGTLTLGNGAMTHTGGSPAPGEQICYYRAYASGLCIQSIDVPTTKEVTDAIRAGNDQVLKAALDAMGKQQTPAQ